MRTAERGVIHRFWDRLPELARPALFVWGEKDWLVPAKFARHVERCLPDASSIVLEDCGHVPQVERPDHIRARWMDENGETHEEELEGLLGICLQHEMDHLEGILFIDHLSRLKREMVLKKLAKMRKEQGKKAA